MLCAQYLDILHILAKSIEHYTNMYIITSIKLNTDINQKILDIKNDVSIRGYSYKSFGF